MLVGVSYSKVEGVAQDKQEATKWFQKAAEKSDNKTKDFLEALIADFKK